MSFNGSGVFNRLYTWVNDAAAAVKIRADRMDNEMNGFATGLTNCVTRDGQSPATANLPMGGFKHTGVAAASSSTEYATFGQLLANGVIYCPTVGGTASAITLSSGHSISAYAAGMAVSFIVGSSVTGATTVNLDGLGAKELTKRGSTALANLDIQAGWLVVAIYDGTRFQVISQRLCKSGDIDSGQVLTSNIGDSNVTTAKIADANVTLAKIANQAQGTILGRTAAAGSGPPVALTTTFKAPTVQKFTSGSGTYTTPANVDYIRVRMIGGGGGGGGSGGSGGTGGTGGNSTFGTTLLEANGGTGGGGFASSVVGTGGSASLGTGPEGINISGSGGATCGPSTTLSSGGAGGCGAFGGGGAGGAGAGAAGSVGGTAATNSGSGGGGAGAGNVNFASGHGGGAGGYVDAIITGPSATYSYAVGAAGTNGTAGTNGSAGGAGAAGVIIVEEFYKLAV